MKSRGSQTARTGREARGPFSGGFWAPVTGGGGPVGQRGFPPPPPASGSGRAGGFVLLPTRGLPAARERRCRVPRAVHSVRGARRLSRVALEMGRGRSHPVRVVGYPHRVPWRDLPVDTARTQLARARRPAGIRRRFRRTLPPAGDLSERVDGRCANRARYVRAHRESPRVYSPDPSSHPRLLMATRRYFLRSLFAAGATLPALKSDALSRILPAIRHADGRSATDVAQDEDFWREIQAAFDIDRGMINLNNGGGAPAPPLLKAPLPRHLAGPDPRTRA